MKHPRIEINRDEGAFVVAINGRVLHVFDDVLAACQYAELAKHWGRPC